jgi:hypothetical protein
MATHVISESAERASYVDWAAIIAGAVLATAVAFLMLTFGTAIGLSFASPYRMPGEGSLWLFAVAAGLWLMWVQGSAYMAGGYLAGRLRRRHFDAVGDEVEVRDGAHGLVVWALGTLIAALVVAFLGTGTVQVAGSAAQVAATAASGNAKGNDGDQTDYLVDVLFRPGAAATAPAGAGASATTPAAPLPGTPPAGVMSTPSGASAVAGAPTMEDSRKEVSRILVVGAARGDVAAEDRARIARLVSERTGMSQAEAQQRVDATLADAKTKAKAAADKARKAGIISAFITIAGLLVGAAAAWWAASMGGRDRDAGTVFTLFGRWGYR